MMVFVLPLFVQAVQEGGGGNPPPGGGGNPAIGPITIANPFKQNTIKDLIETIVNDILLPVGGVIAAVMIIYSGFLFVTAGGDPSKITKARDALLAAVIGAAILLGAWAISQAIKATIDTLRTP